MDRIEKFRPSERGAALFDVTSKAKRLVLERINIESIGLTLPEVPICNMNDAEQIEAFIPRAKEGFSQSLKSERILSSELKKLLEQTTPLVNPYKGIMAMEEEENCLPEYLHSVATLSYLLDLKRVSFFSFTDTPLNMDLDLGLAESYWSMNLFSVDHIWGFLVEMEKFTKEALYQEAPVEIHKLIKVGHFFAAGQEISRIFDK